MRALVDAAMSLGPAAAILVVLAVFVLPLSVRILREYQRGVIFRLGKLLDAKGPGVIFLIPLVDRMVRMDLRIVTIGVAQQEIMTRDNVPATVDAVVYFRIISPTDAVVKVEDFLKATSPFAANSVALLPSSRTEAPNAAIPERCRSITASRELNPVDIRLVQHSAEWSELIILRLRLCYNTVTMRLQPPGLKSF